MKPRVALITLSLMLIGQHYFGDQPMYWKLFPERTTYGAVSWWAGAKIVGYLIIPLIVFLAGGGKLREIGLGWGATTRHAWIYLACLAVVLPMVYVASGTHQFQLTYPFYRGPHQLSWELMYAATFISLEFVFRGYLLFTLASEIGDLAIYVMVVPYVMIHFGKPLAEVVGAVVAGCALGWMALRTRSIWGGVFVHIAVAWSMDFLALYR